MARLHNIKPRLTLAVNSRIGTHQADNWGKGRGGRPWRRLRDSVLLRDNYTCQHCGRVCLPENLCADHIVNRARGGSDELHNLQTLCIACHKVKTAQESRQGWGR